MEIVIKIDDERYKNIQRIAEVQLDRSRFQTAEQVIANGIPLPKGHGRLIDADRLKRDNPLHLGLDVPYVVEDTVEEIIDHAPTIIEADKESEEK